MERPLAHKTTTINAQTHCGNWLRQLRRAGLTYEIVVLEEPQEHELNNSERWWIAYGRASGWRLTNQTDGGDGGSLPGTMSPEGRVQSSLKNRASWTPERRASQSGALNPARRPEVRAKIKAHVNARPAVTETTRAKMSRAAAARPRRPHAEETKEKIRQANLGKVVGEATRQKISAANTGYKHTEEAKAKMSVWRTGDNNVSKRPDVRQKISESHKKNPKVLEHLAAVHERKRVKDVQCGTRLGYARAAQARRKGEPGCGPCDSCKAAAALYAKEARDRKKLT